MNSWAGIDEFLAVAQAHSFVKAAQRLGCSTSQVSREIASLEERLGQRLLYRTTRHVSLTEPGDRFFNRCRRLQEERDDALAAIMDEACNLQGSLRMTCAVAYGERFVAPIVNRFMAQHPRVGVELILTNDVLDLVDGAVDLAVRFGCLVDSRLVAQRLASRTWRLCASPAYLDRAGRPSSIEALSGHACLRGTTENWSFIVDGHAVTHRVIGRLKCNNGNAVLSAALAGLGLCQLPDFYVREHLRSGALIEVLSDNRPREEGVWAVFPNRRHLSQKVRLMVDHLHAHLASDEAEDHPSRRSFPARLKSGVQGYPRSRPTR
jgi:DNA-binding transcriptional LysR family regulator